MYHYSVQQWPGALDLVGNIGIASNQVANESIDRPICFIERETLLGADYLYMEARLRSRTLILLQKICAARSRNFLNRYTVRTTKSPALGLMTCISALFKVMPVFITLPCENVQGINRWADGA